VQPLFLSREEEWDQVNESTKKDKAKNKFSRLIEEV
jgi:hypothetical protein